MVRFLILPLGWLYVMVASASDMVWPTSHPASEGSHFERWAQATVSGDPRSALFGCVRSSGTQFHEGIDIAPHMPRRGDEATDPVRAAFGGTVVHVNGDPRTSSYGRYVVVQHDQYAPAMVTLYAHLASVDRQILPGRRVTAGARLGILGRSAGGYTIPPERAHLHFEIGLRLTDDFQRWYDEQGYATENAHGVFNGMNLIGFDPWATWLWLRDSPGRDLADYFRTIPTGAVIELSTTQVPDIVRRYPSLLAGPVPGEGVAGWRMDITAWGLPVRFEPIPAGTNLAPPGTVRVVAVDSLQLDTFACRELVKFEGGVADLGMRGRRLLEMMFPFGFGR